MKFSRLYIVLLILVFVSCKKQESMILGASDQNLFLNNGVLKFNDQPFTGTLVSHFSNGTLQSEVFYDDGLKNGIEKLWFKDGRFSVERTYNKGLKVGVHKAWWNNGTIKFVYHFNDKGEFHGSVKEWYADGLLFRAFNYENGKEKGSQRLWKPDGSIKSNYEVVNGERFGLIGLKKCYTVTTNSDELF